MGTKNRKVVGLILMVVGAVFIYLTFGRLSWEDSVPGISPDEIMPFWQILVRLGIGLIAILVGYLLRKTAKRTEELIALSDWQLRHR